jgi:Transposase IS4
MHQEVNGARHVALDNRYQCPELAMILREKFKIHSTGTCRQNRKGWNKELMNLTKKNGRGSYKFMVDKDNNIVCCQLVDSKVVNVVSSIMTTEVSKVKRQIGSKKEEFPCPWIVTKYQKNMQGVDKSDQMRAAGGGFAAKAHYQKWYKRVYFAILDMMTLNSLIAWNLSAKVSRLNRCKLKRHEFLWYIAQAMLEYQDNNDAKPAAIQTSKDNRKKPPPVSADLSEHQSIATKDNNAKCIVCRLDHSIERQVLGNQIEDDRTRKETIRQSQKNMWTQLSTCTKCRITAHPTIPSKRREDTWPTNVQRVDLLPNCSHKGGIRGLEKEQQQDRKGLQSANETERCMVYRRCKHENANAMLTMILTVIR